MSWLWVALGGAAGACARFGVARAWDARGGFPWGTFAVNVAGSLALGALLAALPPGDERMRPLLAVGFCGGFTTFSTFSHETLALLQRGSPALALAYAGGSVLAGVLAAWAGVRLAA